MPNAVDVAKHLIHLAAADPDGEPMTALRLHKLLYFCQGWFLAWYGRPLFADRLEAWKNGPVVPTVNAEPWGHGVEPIPDLGGQAALSYEEREAVERVWENYRRYSAWGLSDLTHDEAPWKDHYRPDESGEIPVGDLGAFFKGEYERLTGEQAGSVTIHSLARVLTADQLKQELGW